MTSPMNDKLMTTKEAASKLAVTEGTLANWRSERSQQLTYIKVGKAVRYRESDIASFLERNTVLPPNSEVCSINV